MWRLITTIAATTAFFPWLHNEEHHNQDDHQKKYDTITGPFPGVFLVLSCCLQMLSSSVHKRLSSCHMALNIIQLLTLMLHQNRHVKEYLVQLLETLLQLFDSIMSLLNLIDGVQNPTPALLLNGLLKESLTLTCTKVTNILL